MLVDLYHSMRDEPVPGRSDSDVEEPGNRPKRGWRRCSFDPTAPLADVRAKITQAGQRRLLKAALRFRECGCPYEIGSDSP